MLFWTFLHLAVVLLAGNEDLIPGSRYMSGSNADYGTALDFLREHNEIALRVHHRGQLAEWNYEADQSEHNKEELLESEVEKARFWKESWKNATSFAWKDFKDKNETIYRWFKKILSLRGTAVLSEDKLKKYKSLVDGMKLVIARAYVCPKDTPCELTIDPELTEILEESRDYDELKRDWIDWRNVTGRRLKEPFLEYLKLSNEVAELNGFADKGEMWRQEYESSTFEKDVEELLKAIEPVYRQLHAYVRRRLILQYPESGIRPDGPIPAHMLGPEADSWGIIFDVVKPYEKKEKDVSVRMKELEMTPLDMFKMAEEFFTSLGLMPMTEEFWNRSMFEEPADRERTCPPVASAWDFFDGKDFRIKMCPEITLEDLITIHHEMGHIQYFQQFAHQPFVFRNGANAGFHEAVGETLALSVTTYSHLKKIGLMSNDSDYDEEMEINELMKTALEKVAFVPFGYLVDSWRWKVFRGEFSEDELNSGWWEERLKYQGLCPPVRRTNEDLDAAAREHVIADVPYIRYFVSHIIQFQFHKGLCEAAGHTGPLHQCDIYQSKEAGKLLSDTLSLGSSVHWSQAMKIITRGQTDKMDAQPLLDYFEPLIKWLQKQNEGETLGWKSNDPMVCP